MKKYILGGLVTLGLIALCATQMLTMSREQNAPRHEVPAVQQREMTQRQRVHRSRMRQASGRRLPERVATETGDITTVLGEPHVISIPENQSPPMPFLQRQVCNAEAIVIGTLQSASPQLTANETFLFTEYTLAVEEVIKNNVAAPIQQGGTISIVRDGGVGQLNGRVIRAMVRGFDLFSVGERVLLFLRFIPESGTYLAYANGSLQIDGDRLVPYGRMPASETRNAEDFISASRAAVTAINCANQ